MDCSSPYAMASLIGAEGPLRRRVRQRRRRRPPRHRHARARACMNPNHYLAVAIGYLFRHRPGWRADAGVGKTLVSQLDDRPRGRATSAGALVRGAGRLQVVRRRPARRLVRLRRRGERRAPPSCARTARSGRPTRTASSSICSPARSRAVDRQGPGRALPRRSRRGSARRSTSASTRPATPAQKAALEQALAGAGARPTSWPASRSSRELTRAPGNDAAIGGLKVVDRERLVRGPAVGHRGRLQDLRRELQGREHLRASRRRPARSSARRARGLAPRPALSGKRRMRKAPCNTTASDHRADHQVGYAPSLSTRPEHRPRSRPRSRARRSSVQMYVAFICTPSSRWRATSQQARRRSRPALADETPIISRRLRIAPDAALGAAPRPARLRASASCRHPHSRAARRFRRRPRRPTA